MAAITSTALVINDKVTAPTPAVLTANDTYQNIPVTRLASRLTVLQIVVATAATTTTIKAGATPPAIAGGQGDLVFTSLATGTYFVVLESGRFLQADGNIQIKAATAANVSVAVLQTPRGLG